MTNPEISQLMKEMREKAQPCPNCGRVDGWHTAEGHPPPPVGDCRKVVWLRDADGMEWWGVRAYSGFRGGWAINGREESSTVLYWRDGPESPAYPPPANILKLLDYFERAEEGRWISVDQELPDIGSRVLVWKTNAECEHIANYQPQRYPEFPWRDPFNGGDGPSISHWMLLPDPPDPKPSLSETSEIEEE